MFQIPSWLRRFSVFLFRLMGILICLSSLNILFYSDQPPVLAVIFPLMIGVLFLLGANFLKKGEILPSSLACISRFTSEALACDVCGQKLVITKTPAALDSPPQMVMKWKKNDYAYYCCTCKKYLKTDCAYRPYSAPQTSAPDGAGTRYHFTKAFFRKTLLSSLAIYAVGFLVLLLLFIPSASSNPAFILAPILFLVFAIFSLLRNYKLRTSYWELFISGLTIFNAGNGSSQYYPWSSFLLANRDDGGNWLFATEKGNFAISDNIGGWQALIDAILREIPGSVTANSNRPE